MPSLRKHNLIINMKKKLISFKSYNYMIIVYLMYCKSLKINKKWN